MRGCELVIEEIPARTYCEACGATYETVAHGRTCPVCGSERTYLVQGDEAVIKEIATPDEGPGDGERPRAAPQRSGAALRVLLRKALDVQRARDDVLDDVTSTSGLRADKEDEAA